MTTYEQNKINKLIAEVNEDLIECKNDMQKNISEGNKAELQSDTSFIIADCLRRLQVLQSHHVFLNNEDTIKANRLLYIVNHIIKDIEV